MTDINALIANESYKRNRSNEIQGYKYIPSLSNDELAVYRKGDKYVLSSRGTSLDKDRISSDISQDISLLFNKSQSNKVSSDRIHNIKRVIQRIKINPNANIELTGHSLGGNVSIQAMNDDYINNNVNSVVTYNAGSSPIGIKFNGDANKITNNIIEGDEISKHTLPGRNVIYTNKSKSKISEKVIDAVLKTGISKDIIKGVARNHGMNNFINGNIEKKQETVKTTGQVIDEVRKIKTGTEVGLQVLRKGGKIAQKTKKLVRVGKTAAKIGEAGIEIVDPLFDAILLADFGISKFKRGQLALKIFNDLGERANPEEHGNTPFLQRSVRIEIFGEFLAQAKEALDSEEPDSDIYRQSEALLKDPALFWALTKNFADNSSLGSKAEILGLEIGSGHRWNEFLNIHDLSNIKSRQPQVLTQQQITDIEHQEQIKRKIDAFNKQIENITDLDRHESLIAHGLIKSDQEVLEEQVGSERNIFDVNSYLDNQSTSIRNVFDIY
jgi:hypothetical protein